MPFIAITGCNDVLDVENTNDPDFLKVYATGEDVENVAAGLFNSYYVGSHAYTGVEMMLATAADNVSCSWGNSAMRDMSWEPRNNAWTNTPSYGNRGTTKNFFDKMYAGINTANNVLNALAAGVEIGSGGSGNARAQAVARFTQGICYGNLAMVFDKTFIVDEDKTVEPELDAASPYMEVAAAAVSYLEEAISISKSNDFTLPASWLGTESDLSNADFAKLCNTYAARIISYTPRNKTEMMAADWDKVKAFADAGITSDFNIVNDGYNNWYYEAGDYLTYNGWGITDMYVVHLMDPTQPQHWDDDPSFPHPPESTDPIDSRLFTDFAYVGSNWFQAARGYYHYSNYRSNRYDAFYVNATGPKSEVLLSENDMLRAEARLYSSSPNLSEAAAIINAGTRVTRGEMTPVDANADAIRQAIHHERHVEMYIAGMGIQFFEMRKLDLLQTGTPLHLPLPAETLQTFGLSEPYYTFGTVANADGINTSNGGWR